MKTKVPNLPNSPVTAANGTLVLFEPNPAVAVIAAAMATRNLRAAKKAKIV
jgi:hypothetical protein